MKIERSGLSKKATALMDHFGIETVERLLEVGPDRMERAIHAIGLRTLIEIYLQVIRQMTRADDVKP